MNPGCVVNPTPNGNFQMKRTSIIALAFVGTLGICSSALADNDNLRLVGGERRDLFVHCDLNTWRCTGTFNPEKATRFQQIPGRDPSREGWNMYRVQNSNMCLNVWGGTNDVNIYPCSPIDEAPNNFLFNNFSGGEVATPYNGFRRLWWQGEGAQIVTVPGCLFAWQCLWRFN